MTRLLAGLGLVLLVAGAQAQDDDYWAEDYDSGTAWFKIIII